MATQTPRTELTPHHARMALEAYRRRQREEKTPLAKGGGWRLLPGDVTTGDVVFVCLFVVLLLLVGVVAFTVGV